MRDEVWLSHVKILAESKEKLQVEVRKLRLQVTALQDDNDHLGRELARQNARILTMVIEREIETVQPIKPVLLPKKEEEKRCRCGDYAGPNRTCNWGDNGCYNCPA